MESPRFEDFRYTRMPEVKDNIFSWFGNGLTIAQERRERTTQYLDEVDIPPTINHGPRPKTTVSSDVKEKLDEKTLHIAESVSTMPS